MMKSDLDKGFSIRPFRMEDHESAWQLWERELPHSHDSSWNYPMTERFIRHNRELCFCAFRGENLIGTVMGSFDGRRGYVQHLAVDSTCRNEGLGKALMKALMEQMAALDIRKVHLLIKKDNSAVREYYEKMDWGIREDVLLMSIRLKEEDPLPG